MTSAGSTGCVTTLTLQSSAQKSLVANFSIPNGSVNRNVPRPEGRSEEQLKVCYTTFMSRCLATVPNFISLDFNFCTRHRVLNPPGGGSSISFGGPSLPASQPKPKQEAPPPAPPPSKQQPVAPAAPSTRRPSSKVTAPPGGHSQITFG